jgi:STAS domain
MSPDRPSPITIELGPSFGASDAAALHEALAHAAPGTAVEIRFHRVREWEASALAVLARELAERGPEVEVHGLSQRQLRVLHSLGVDARG